MIRPLNHQIACKTITSLSNRRIEALGFGRNTVSQNEIFRTAHGLLSLQSGKLKKNGERLDLLVGSAINGPTRFGESRLRLNVPELVRSRVFGIAQWRPRKLAITVKGMLCCP